MTPELTQILIAEDHSVSRNLLARNLSRFGFQVSTAENGDEAMQILEREDAPPIAILDWMMPGLDGLEVCRRVRAQSGRRYTYLILLTAKQDKSEITAGLEAGADDYVVKPFDQDELRARLKVGQRVVALERQLAERVTELESALADVRKLKRLLPICMYCKNIRDGRDYWHEIEEYIHTETGTDFSHGICPACMKKVLHESAMLSVAAEAP